MNANEVETTQSKAEILRERAGRLAKRLDDQSQRKVLWEVALLAVGKERFAVPSKGLREIVTLPEITRLPGLARHFLGIAQIRGELMSVVDIASWLGVETSGKPESMAVLESEQGLLGLAAETVLGFRNIYADEIAEDFRSERAEGGRPICATTNDLVAVFDIGRLFNGLDLVVGGR